MDGDGWDWVVLWVELIAVPIRQCPCAKHDSLEDALAAREVALWCLSNTEAFNEWGEKKRKTILTENAWSKGKQKHYGKPRQAGNLQYLSDYLRILVRMMSVRLYAGSILRKIAVGHIQIQDTIRGRIKLVFPYMTERGSRQMDRHLVHKSGAEITRTYVLSRCKGSPYSWQQAQRACDCLSTPV